MRPHGLFWQAHPALLYGLSLLVGSSAFLFWPFPFNWLLPLSWGVYLSLLKRWPPLLLVLLSAAYARFLYPADPLPEKVSGYFSLSSLQPHQTPFQKGLLYKGTLYLDGRQIPCAVASSSEPRKAADCDYLLEGTLKQRGPYEYALKPKQWLPVEHSFSLAELRYQAKETFRRFLEKHLPSPRVANLLGSLTTGDVEDRSLRYEFSRLGLQHLLAISGFHFGLLIAACTFFLSLFLPQKLKTVALLIAVNLYFLFVGSTPAVLRSWLTASLYLLGKLTGRHASGLNLLGVCLCIELLLDPLVSANLGFQLSFLSCGGILLFYPLFERTLQSLFPRRPLLQTDALNTLSKHGHLFSSSLRKACSLTLAVNAAIWPLLLYHFHQFPLLSLLYNLFFPFLLSLSLFGLLVSSLAHLLFPPLASLLFQAVDTFTAQLIDLAAYPPLPLDYSLRVLDFPAWVIPLYLFLLFGISIHRLERL